MKICYAASHAREIFPSFHFQSKKLLQVDGGRKDRPPKHPFRCLDFYSYEILNIKHIEYTLSLVINDYNTREVADHFLLICKALKKLASSEDATAISEI